MTRQCVTAASTLLQALDDGVDPCDDFYQYACGGWIKANTIPPGESRWDTFGMLRRKNQLVIKNLLGKPMPRSTDQKYACSSRGIKGDFTF